MVKASSPATREQINIRATRTQRDTIDQAAALSGKSRTDFILESAVRDAQHVLLDQCFFQLDEASFNRVVELLDNPPEPSGVLRRLLATPAPWE